MASGSTPTKEALEEKIPGKETPRGKLPAGLVTSFYLVAVLLGLYHLAMLSGLTASGDGAKLQLVGSTWGTPHHSGYPLWTMLANLLHRILPFGTPAYHVDLLSALSSVVGSLFFFAAAQVLGLRRGTAFALALTFGATATLWSQSIQAEVYTLHYAFLAAVFFFLLRWAAQKREYDLCWAIALYALSFSNHLTAICLAPAVLVFVLVTDRTRLLSPRVWAAGLLGASVTLLTYGYIVLRTLDPTTFYLESQGTSLWEVLAHLASDPKRGHYFTKELGLLLTERFPFVVLTVVRELHVLLPLSLLGAIRAPWRTNLLLGQSALGNLAFITSFTVPDSYVYFLPLYLILGLWAALGLASLSGWMSAWISTRNKGASMRWAPLSGLVLLVLGFLGPRIPESLSTHTHLRSQDKAFNETLNRLPKSGALLLSTDYEISMALLVRAARGPAQNPDIHVIHTPPATLSLDVAFQPLRRYLEEGLQLRQRERAGWIEGGLPAYCLCRLPTHATALEQLGFVAQPLGQKLYRITPAPGAPPPLPRLVVVHALEGARDLNEAVALLRRPDFSPDRTAIVLGSRSAGDPALQRGVRYWKTHHEENRVEVTLELDTPGWLQWTETVSARWLVQVDGVEQPKLELNALFPAVALTAGDHHVTFSRSSN